MVLGGEGLCAIYVCYRLVIGGESPIHMSSDKGKRTLNKIVPGIVYRLPLDNLNRVYRIYLDS